jgi:hypothetical protein
MAHDAWPPVPLLLPGNDPDDIAAVIEQIQSITAEHGPVTGPSRPGTVTDPTHKVDLVLLARYVIPAEIRHAGQARITGHPCSAADGTRRDTVDRLVTAALAAAQSQRIPVPGEEVAAAIVKDLAAEALWSRVKINHLDAQIAELLDSHPDAALVQSLPGMGAVLTAEFLAAAGGISPLHQR